MITMLGKYKTNNGLDARVSRIDSLGDSWVLVGAICNDGVYYLHCWCAQGHSAAGEPFNLVAA